MGINSLGLDVSGSRSLQTSKRRCRGYSWVYESGVEGQVRAASEGMASEAVVWGCDSQQPP